MDAFRTEASFVAQSAQRAKVPPGRDAVRLPGERALALKRSQIATGFLLPASLRNRLVRASPAFAVILSD